MSVTTRSRRRATAPNSRVKRNARRASRAVARRRVPKGFRDRDILWAAGLFEGEGSVSPSGKTRVRLEVAGTDRDTIEEFGRVIRYGKLYGPYNCIHRDGSTRKDMYHWIVSRDDEARRVARRLLPYLHGRRTERIRQLLAR